MSNPQIYDNTLEYMIIHVKKDRPEKVEICLFHLIYEVTWSGLSGPGWNKVFPESVEVWALERSSWLQGKLWSSVKIHLMSLLMALAWCYASAYLLPSDAALTLAPLRWSPFDSLSRSAGYQTLLSGDGKGTSVSGKVQQRQRKQIVGKADVLLILLFISFFKREQTTLNFTVTKALISQAPI